MNKNGKKAGKISTSILTTALATTLISGVVLAANGDMSISLSGISTAVENYIDREEVKDAHINIAGISAILSDYYSVDSVEAAVASKSDIDTLLMLGSGEQQKTADSSKVSVTNSSAKKPAKKAAAKNSNKVSYAGYKNLGVANVTNYLNVRKEPEINGKIVGKLPMNAGCEILGKTGGWYKIKSGKVSGYVSSEYLLTGNKALQRAKKEIATVATVTCDQLKVRKEPNTNCEVLSRVAEGENLEVIEVRNGWVAININNNLGYVCADYVKIHKSLPVGVTVAELSYGSTVSNTVVDVISYAKQFLGNPYVYGGTSLTNGTDCSGFTMRIFEHFGYSLNRSSAAQSYNGTPVDLSAIQPGDLLFYSYGGSIGHVAIYIGGGQIIHASTERTGITIGNAFYQTPTCARRIIN